MLYPILDLLGAYASKYGQVCNSSIYCTGELLHSVQLAKIFPDSKTFVDLKLLNSEEEIFSCFIRLMAITDNSPTRDQLMAFLDQHFEEKEELLYWHPPDYQSHPPVLNKIKNLNILLFAKDIISMWPTLGRKVSTDVAWNSEYYSFLYVPKGFIISGGRFKELYYWDSYWIVRGLIISNMMETAKGMIENFLHLVKRFGYVPIGSRIYYLGRSQPPLLTWMVYDYFAATGDIKWLKNIIPVVESELTYWLENNKLEMKVKGIEYKLLRYSSVSKVMGPRPESYYEDYMNAKKVPESIHDVFYTHITSAAESGWDFSSRWVTHSGDMQFNPTDVTTAQILPVDLNSIFAGSLKKFGELKSKLKLSGTKWYRLAKEWRYAIDFFFWDPEDGVWYDFDSQTMSKRKKFYLSCAAPLWAGAVEVYNIKDHAKRFISYLQSTGVLQYNGGVPVSLWKTGEQWDFPNAWPPLQSILIGALENSNCSQGKRLARKLAKVWFSANYIGYKKSQKMFEKYSCLNPGEQGQGGDYEVQNGFGWTNGVILELIQNYGDMLY